MENAPSSFRRSAHLKLALLCLAGFGIARGAVAAGTTVSDNPYKVIFLRNLFGLHPVVAAPVIPPPVPSSTIVLTGITTISGGSRAFLEITPPAKPPQPAKHISCILAEGQREGPVEVVQIDPKNGSVKVSDNGTLTTLTFEKNGRKTSAMPAAPQAVAHTFRLPRPSK
jgi:hypothetical protein